MKTKTIQIYDPALCCSTGVCGPDIDPKLVEVASLVEHFRKEGHCVERYNLGQQPIEFVRNAAVKERLDRDGIEALPLVFVDGKVVSSGRYPDLEDWDRFLEEAAVS